MESWVIALIVLLVLMFTGGVAVLFHNVTFKLLYYLIVRTPAGDWYLAAQLRIFSRPHSSTVTQEHAKCIIRTVAFLEDNYAYLIVDTATGATAVVDPGDAAAVSTALNDIAAEWARGQLPSVAAAPHLTHILVTHYHYDHAGGVPALCRAHPDVAVVHSGSEYSRHVAATSSSTRRIVVKDGDRVTVGAGVIVRVLTAPCHTRGHVLFLVDLGHGGTALFSGDTLFSGGVGKFFEGDASEMYAALYDTLPRHALLSDAVRLYPGHEYALDNVSFAAWLQPGDACVQAKLRTVKAARAARQPTIGSTLREEAGYNPYLRVHEREVQEAVRAHAHLVRGAAALDASSTRQQQINVMAALRALKDARAHIPKGAQSSSSATAESSAGVSASEDKKA